ncbi:MAG: hypothetical protein EOO38_03850, partial [Cytophagaceae bacterium]
MTYDDQYFETLPASVRADWDNWLVYGLCNPQDYAQLHAYACWLEKNRPEHWSRLDKRQASRNRAPDPRYTAALKAVAEAM